MRRDHVGKLLPVDCQHVKDTLINQAKERKQAPEQSVLATPQPPAPAPISSPSPQRSSTPADRPTKRRKGNSRNSPLVQVEESPVCLLSSVARFKLLTLMQSPRERSPPLNPIQPLIDILQQRSADFQAEIDKAEAAHRDAQTRHQEAAESHQKCQRKVIECQEAFDTAQRQQQACEALVETTSTQRTALQAFIDAHSPTLPEVQAAINAYNQRIVDDTAKLDALKVDMDIAAHEQDLAVEEEADARSTWRLCLAEASRLEGDLVSVGGHRLNKERGDNLAKLVGMGPNSLGRLEEQFPGVGAWIAQLPLENSDWFVGSGLETETVVEEPVVDEARGVGGDGTMDVDSSI